MFVSSLRLCLYRLCLCHRNKMAAGIDTYIANLSGKYWDLGSNLGLCRDNLNAAGAALKAGNTGNAGYFLEQAAIDMGHSSDDVFAEASSVRSWDILLWLWVNANWPDVVPLTATSICEAWAKDEFKDRALTIAFIDRMRQLIWDEPFSVVWASKPEDSES